jgi:hypothetical protein
MHDWRQTIRERIESHRLPQAHREEVISELAAHLEEDFYDARSRGLTDTEAFAGGDVVLLANGWPVCQFFGAVGAYLSQRARAPSECGWRSDFHGHLFCSAFSVRSLRWLWLMTEFPDSVSLRFH